MILLDFSKRDILFFASEIILRYFLAFKVLEMVFFIMDRFLRADEDICVGLDSFMMQLFFPDFFGFLLLFVDLLEKLLKVLILVGFQLVNNIIVDRMAAL